MGEIPRMLELVLSVCFVASPHHCKDVSLIFANVTPAQCNRGFMAQSEMAKWVAEHPNWQIARWRCQEAGKFARL
jgi:hypothetical protein